MANKEQMELPGTCRTEGSFESLTEVELPQTFVQWEKFSRRNSSTGTWDPLPTGQLLPLIISDSKESFSDITGFTSDETMQRCL